MTGVAVFKSVILIVTLLKVTASTAPVQLQLRTVTKSTDQLDLPPPGIEHRPATDVNIEATSVDYCLLHSQNWIVYTGNYYNSIIGSNTGVSSSTYTSSSNGWTVGLTGVPNYDRTFTAANVAALNARPKASSDFRSGVLLLRWLTHGIPLVATSVIKSKVATKDTFHQARFVLLLKLDLRVLFPLTLHWRLDLVVMRLVHLRVSMLRGHHCGVGQI